MNISYQKAPTSCQSRPHTLSTPESTTSLLYLFCKPLGCRSLSLSLCMFVPSQGMLSFLLYDSNSRNRKGKTGANQPNQKKTKTTLCKFMAVLKLWPFPKTPQNFSMHLTQKSALPQLVKTCYDMVTSANLCLRRQLNVMSHVKLRDFGGPRYKTIKWYEWGCA